MPNEFTAPGTPSTDTPYVDPDLDTLDVEPDGTDLDDLRAELAADVTPTTTIPVTGRTGDYAVRFRTDFTGKELEAIRKKAKDRRMSDGIDGVRFASLLLATTCQGITRGGRDLSEVLDTRGPVTFTTPELQQLLATTNADETVRRLYGLEGYVDSAARRLMAEAGWGDEVDAMDPTQ